MLKVEHPKLEGYEVLYEDQWLNSVRTGRNGVPPPEIAVIVPKPGNDVPSSFWGKSLKLLPPEVRF